MPLHPDIEGFLELVEFGRLTGKSQPMHELSPQQAREQFAQASRLLDSAPAGNLEITQLTIPSRDGQPLAARAYQRAQGAERLRPVLVYFHGGGYVVGSLDSHDTLCRRLALAGTSWCCRRTTGWRRSTSSPPHSTMPRTWRCGCSMKAPVMAWMPGGWRWQATASAAA